MSPLPQQGWLFLIELLKCRNTSKCELGGFSLRQSHMHEALTYKICETYKVIKNKKQSSAQNKNICNYLI